MSDSESGDSSLLSFKLDWLVVERPRLVVNYHNLSTPMAFVKILVVCRFMLMCCKSTSPAKTYSQMK